MPVYNGEAYIEEAIESILQQTYQNFEAIFIDDCSTDSSAAIIKTYQQRDSRIKYVKTPYNNGGPAMPKNIGLFVSEGDFVSFLDQDDILLSNKLEIANKVFLETPSLDIVFFDYIPYIKDAENTPYLKSANFLEKAKNYLNKTETPNLYKCERFYGCLAGIQTGMTTQTIVCKNEVFKKIKFDTRFKIVDDISAWYQISEQFNCGFYDTPVALYRHHPEALTTNSLLLAEETLAFHQANFFRQYHLYNSEEVKRYKAMLARFYVRKASQKTIDNNQERYLLFNALYFDFKLKYLYWFFKTFLKIFFKKAK